MDQGFAGIVTLKLRAEDIEEFKAIATEAADAMSDEKEFQHLSIYTLAGDPNTLVVFEAWSCNYEHFTNELRNKPYRNRLNAALGSMSAEERQIALLDHIASFPSRSTNSKPAGN